MDQHKNKTMKTIANKYPREDSADNKDQEKKYSIKGFKLGGQKCGYLNSVKGKSTHDLDIKNGPSYMIQPKSPRKAKIDKMFITGKVIEQDNDNPRYFQEQARQSKSMKNQNITEYNPMTSSNILNGTSSTKNKHNSAGKEINFLNRLQSEQNTSPSRLIKQNKGEKKTDFPQISAFPMND